MIALAQAILDARTAIGRLYGLTPAQINMGHCDLFAVRVCRRVGIHAPSHVVWLSVIDRDQLQVLRSGGELTDHAVIQIAGRFYDAECPEGIESIEDLPVLRFRADRQRYPSIQGRLLPDIQPGKW